MIAGQTVNLAGLGPYAEDPDRPVGTKPNRSRWRFFEANAAELDRLSTTNSLGCGTAWPASSVSQTYTPLGYRRMRRVDYGPDDVARYREQVATHVVPLVGRLLEARRVGKWLGPAALLG